MRQQYHVKLIYSGYQLLSQAMLDFRNRVTKGKGPAEDIIDLIPKITKHIVNTPFTEMAFRPEHEVRPMEFSNSAPLVPKNEQAMST